MNSLHPIAAALALLLSISASQGETYIGYTNGNITRNENVYRFGTRTTQGVLMYVPAQKAAALSGHQLTGIRTAIPSRQYSNLKLYYTKSLSGSALSLQDLNGTNSTNSFAPFTIDSPITLDGEPFYIGLQMTVSDTSRKMLYFDAANDFAQDSLFWALNNGNWVDVTHEGMGAPFLQMILDGEVAMTDVIVKSASALDASGASFLQAGSPINLTSEIHNFGTTTITGYDVICQVGDEETRFSYSDVSIAPNQDAMVSVDNYVTQNGGDLPLQVRIENLQNDQQLTECDASDNETMSAAYVYPSSCQKKALVEVYTGAFCSNCPTGHTYLHEAIKGQEDKVVMVDHHSYVSGGTTDVYSIYESLLVSYWLGVTGFPSASYNRMQVTNGDDCVVYYATSLSDDKAGVEACLKTEPYVSIDLENQLNTSTGRGTLTARLHAYNLPASSDGNCRINAWILQDSIIGYQSSGGANYTHMEVVRKFLTDTYGDKIQLTKGQDTEVSFDYELPSEGFPSTGYTYYSGKDYNIEAELANMKFVVSVGEVSEANTSPIYNVAEIQMSDGASGIETVTTSGTGNALSETFHDLLGRSITSSTRGKFVIRDGQKMILK